MDIGTPPNAKVRVDAVTKQLDSKQRCLITNVECDEVTEYAHVLGHALEDNDGLMATLEFSWKKKYRTQSIHTHENIFRLSAKFHRLFDKNKWLLLPETRILDQYEEAYRKPHLFPTIEEETYRYTLVAHPDMRFVPIHRRDETLPLSPNAFEKFVYPFEGFPTIVSHVHPRFVICNAALKCESRETLYAFAKGKEGELFNALARIARIYVGWSRVDLPNDFRKERKVPKVKPREKIDRQVKRDVPTNVPNAEHSDDEGVPPTIAATSAHRSVRAHSLANETPADRAGDFDLKKAKARVDTVAIKRCLIENTDESNALEYAHVLGRRSSNKILTALEYSWGMEHETLNVDTRYNIFRLNRTFHRLFDTDAWLLIPEPAIIDEYHAAITQRAKFPSLERPKFPSLENYQPPYSYTLLVIYPMEHVPIHVQCGKEDNESSDKVDLNLQDAFGCHIYPFHGFPVIKSHVHPRFVICNSGDKLQPLHMDLEYHNTAHISHQTALDQIKVIYASWTKPGIIPKEFVNAGPLHQEKPSDDCPDDKTEPRRLRSHTKGKRITSPLIGDVPSKPSKRAKSGGANDSAWLDDATLAGLERDHSPKKTWHDKVAWIQSWVGQVPMDATVEEVPMEIEVVDKQACQTFDECVSDSDDMESLLSA